jgi:hypothetical protein
LAHSHMQILAVAVVRNLHARHHISMISYLSR